MDEYCYRKARAYAMNSVQQQQTAEPQQSYQAKTERVVVQKPQATPQPHQTAAGEYTEPLPMFLMRGRE